MVLFKDTEIKSFLEAGVKKGASNKKLGIMDEDKASKVIDAIVTLKKIEGANKRVIAGALVMGIGQNGGSNKNVGMVAYSLNDYTLSNIELNKVIASIDKEATPRQFFRGIRDDVQQLAAVFNEPGDLSKLMLVDNPDASIQEQTWCSNFQTNNPNCPEKVREWLSHNAKQRFNK